MEHIVLLGDSIFDNAAYVPAGTQVSMQLQARLPAHQISLLARDGAVLADMVGQVDHLAGLPQPATRLVISCGGNDVLELVGAFSARGRGTIGVVAGGVPARVSANAQRGAISADASCGGDDLRRRARPRDGVAHCAGALQRRDPARGRTARAAGVRPAPRLQRPGRLCVLVADRTLSLGRCQDRSDDRSVDRKQDGRAAHGRVCRPVARRIVFPKCNIFGNMKF